jgi:hypothetical protein
MKPPYILISLFTFSDIYSEEKGTAFLAKWLEKYPQLFPETLHWYEGKNSTYPVEGIYTFVPGVVTKFSAGKPMPFWKVGGWFFSTIKSKLKGSGSYWLGGLDYQKSSTIKLQLSYDSKINWRQVFLDLAAWFDASFGWLHLVTKREMELIGDPDRTGKETLRGTNFSGVYPVDRVRGFPVHGMPAPGWLTLYGGPFLPLMGKNLPNVPETHRVERGGMVFVQLSEKIEDLVSDLDNIITTQRNLMKIIGEEYFELLHPPENRPHNSYYFQLDGTLGYK